MRPCQTRLDLVKPVTLRVAVAGRYLGSRCGPAAGIQGPAEDRHQPSLYVGHLTLELVQVQLEALREESQLRPDNLTSPDCHLQDSPGRLGR